MTDGGGNAAGEYAGQPLKVSCASSTEGLALPSLCLRHVDMPQMSSSIGDELKSNVLNVRVL